MTNSDMANERADQPDEAPTNELLKLSAEYDLRTQDRHAMGAQKYGPVNFLEVDSLEMAIEEVLDIGNYARYSYIKLRLIQQGLQAMTDEAPKLGKDGFIKS